MIVTPLRVDLITDVMELMQGGQPFIAPRTYSDYWLYATLFSSTCPVALIEDTLAGTVIAFRSQDDPQSIYVQDVMTHPDHRRRGVTRMLLDKVREQGEAWGCRQLYLTSEPGNAVADRAWKALGFTNIPGDRMHGGTSVIADFKGPGRSRAVYELLLAGR